MHKILFFILFLFVNSAYGQTNKLYEKTFTKFDGINIDAITALCFDNDGFLWLGGSNLDSRKIVVSERKLELQRFDGLSFHNIPLPDYDNEIIGIEQIYKRRDGQFYIIARLTEGYQVLLLNPYTSIYKHVKFEGFEFALDGVSNIYAHNGEDYLLLQKNETIYLKKLSLNLASTDIFDFTIKDKKFTIESSSRILPFDDFLMITDDNFPVHVFDWKGQLLKVIDTVEEDTKSFERVVIDEVFKQDNKDYAFLRLNPNLYEINTGTKTLDLIKGVALENEHLNTFNDANDNALLFASEDNTISVNTFENNKIAQTFVLNFKAFDGIKIATKNLSKEFWLATNGELHYVKLPNATIKTFFDNYAIRAIKPLDSSNYLVATESGGWFILNPENNFTDAYNPLLDDKLLWAGSVNFIMENDVIWTHGNAGVVKVNKQTRKAESFKHYPITCLEKPNDSLIIYGTKGYNLMQFNTLTNTHKPLVKTDTLDIYDLEIRDENLVVAATDKGLLTYNLKSKETLFFNDESQLKDKFILMLDYHEDYGYLLGTRSGHITAFNPENESFKTLYKDELKAGIATILFDNNLWWINTFNGTVAFSPKNETQTRFSEKDGFSHYEANRYSALKIKDHFFVGTIKGLNYFNPRELKPQKDSANLELLRVRKFDNISKDFKDYFNRLDFDSENRIDIPSENRALELGFGLKNTDAVDNGYRFRYRLNDKDWVNLNQQNTIQFANLAAGNYTLEIEAIDFSGNKIGDSLILKIASTEFFYKTWWFLTLVCVFVVSFLLWLLYQTREKKKLQERFSQDLIQSQEVERKRIASELHDSVSQQLTLIKRKAQNNNQDDISELTNNALEEVRHISRGLFPPLLKQLGLTESIEQLTLDIDEKTDVFVSATIENLDANFNQAQALNIYRFIQECITNILKHSNAEALSLTIHKKEKLVTILIQDNGKGFNYSDAENKNSLGLKTLQERIRFLKGELSIDSKPNNGTIVTAKIPI